MQQLILRFAAGAAQLQNLPATMRTQFSQKIPRQPLHWSLNQHRPTMGNAPLWHWLIHLQMHVHQHGSQPSGHQPAPVNLARACLGVLSLCPTACLSSAFFFLPHQTFLSLTITMLASLQTIKHLHLTFPSLFFSVPRFCLQSLCSRIKKGNIGQKAYEAVRITVKVVIQAMNSPSFRR